MKAAVQPGPGSDLLRYLMTAKRTLQWRSGIDTEEPQAVAECPSLLAVAMPVV
jgi:hypothetical protein